MKFGLCLLAAMLPHAMAGPTAVVETARQIPVAASVDVVVVGGSVAGVSAAVAAAAKGNSVFLIAPRLELGEDIVDTLHLWLEPGETATGPITERIFAKPGPAPPLRVKQTLENALLTAGVRFLFGCYATDVLTDRGGHLAGIVMANRAGRQAVIAKVIVDATVYASVARRAGARFHAWSGGTVEARRVVLGGKSANEEAIRRRVSVPACPTPRIPSRLPRSPGRPNDDGARVPEMSE